MLQCSVVDRWVQSDHVFLIHPYLLWPIGDIYLTFLQENLPELLEVVPLEVRHEIWFQHDGVPAHCTEVVREYLDETFGNRWIGHGGPIT
jgi:hypothetical protein